MIIAQNDERKNLAQLELDFMRQCCHTRNNYTIQYLASNVVKEKSSEHYFILMEFGPYGNLFDLIASRQSQGKGLTESEILSLIRAINNCLLFIHESNYVHCDLKIENVLFFDFSSVKLCDFGSVSQYSLDFSQIQDSQFHTYTEIFEK